MYVRRSLVPCLLLALLAVAAAACAPRPGPSPTPATPAPSGSPPTGSTPSPPPGATPSGLPDLGALKLGVRELVTGLSSPVQAVDAGDVAGRLYVVEQSGRIVIVEGGAVRSAPFLDISARTRAGGERGLLSVAFARDHEASGRLYVNYTDRNGNTAIERYQRSEDGSAADPTSASLVLAIDQPFPNHNGGLVLFGPDGYLYTGMGDGGAGGDPYDNAQRGDTLLGKMLRLDVSGGGYSVPADNPFVGVPGVRDEIWALGLRNPWRFSFDRLTGDLWIGDVGQSSWEEIDFQPGTSGGGENYGWRRMEGPDCYDGACDPVDYVLPVAAYRHGQGDCSVVGGYVYRGSAIPELRGIYLFADTCSGRLWGLHASAAASGSAQQVLLLETGLTVSSFGEDRDGELYLTDLSRGGLYQVVGAP